MSLRTRPSCLLTQRSYRQKKGVKKHQKMYVRGEMSLVFWELFCFQLSDAISIIGREDFPMKWPDLITEMVSKFQTGDFHIINGILRTAHSIFKRYSSHSNFFIQWNQEIFTSYLSCVKTEVPIDYKKCKKKKKKKNGFRLNNCWVV